LKKLLAVVEILASGGIAKKNKHKGQCKCPHAIERMLSEHFYSPDSANLRITVQLKYNKIACLSKAS
jgi:hypothetical protein